MELDEEGGEFKIIMHHCPSKGRLLQLSHVEPYHDYCGHCDVLYRRVLEPLGFEYIKDVSECDQARCSTIIREKRKSAPEEGDDEQVANSNSEQGR